MSKPEPSEQIAAYDFVNEMAQRRVDHWRENSPMWYGWALREAFLAGVAWAKTRKGDDVD